jgi:hypothetical protein
VRACDAGSCHIGHAAEDIDQRAVPLREVAPCGLPLLQERIVVSSSPPPRVNLLRSCASAPLSSRGWFLPQASRGKSTLRP